jgi:hypothetical protein
MEEERHGRELDVHPVTAADAAAAREVLKVALSRRILRLRRGDPLAAIDAEWQAAVSDAVQMLHRYYTQEWEARS